MPELDVLAAAQIRALAEPFIETRINLSTDALKPTKTYPGLSAT